MYSPPRESPASSVSGFYDRLSLDSDASRTVLVVDDRQSTRESLVRRLEEKDLESLTANSGKQALKTIKERDIDLVLLDLLMPGMDGFEVLRRVRGDFQLSELPIIVLTVRENQEDMRKALELGASDYVVKSTDSKVLLARIKTHLRLKNAIDRIVKQSNRDPLTDLLNRRAFRDKLDQEHERFQRYGKPYSIIMLDIDHFKSVNDNYGHSTGDKVLKQLARRLESNLRSPDLIARYGGEEFVFLMPETDHENALEAAEKIRKRVKNEPFPANDEDLSIRISAGVSTQDPEDPIAPEQLLKRADEALYNAKEVGRDTVRGK